ncbi:MAG: hypothetical protein ACXVW6_08475 [Nocardioidaceae bacterium]
MSTDGHDPYDPQQPPATPGGPGDPGSGALPPPPPGTYGYGGPGDYGQPAAPYSIGNAFSYGWKKFTENVGPILLAMLAIAVGVIMLQLIGNAISTSLMTTKTTAGLDAQGNPTFTSTGGATFASITVSLLFSVVSFVVNLGIQAGIIRGALDLTYGRPLSLGSMFSGLNLVQVALASVILAILTVVGLVLCILPGLVVLFFTAYTLYFVIDKEMSAIEAIQASATLVNRNFGVLLGFFLATVLAYVVGALLCGVGLLAAIPIVLIATAYTYRTLQGETVAP